MTAQVAVLYSGRWFGVATKPWVQNHLDHLIVPNQAAVFLTCSRQFWCSETAARAARKDQQEAEHMLQREVQRVFGDKVETHAALIEEPSLTLSQALNITRDALAVAGGRPGLASQFTTRMIHNFKHQFAKVAATDALRRMLGVRHRLVVRARLDVQFEHVGPLIAPAPQTIFALPMSLSSDTRNFTRVWSASKLAESYHDWFFVATDEGMAAIGQTAALDVPIRVNMSRRCYGLCVEEQLQLQLAALGVELRPLSPAGAFGLFHPARILSDWNAHSRLISLARSKDASEGCERLASESLLLQALRQKTLRGQG